MTTLFRLGAIGLLFLGLELGLSVESLAILVGAYLTATVVLVRITENRARRKHDLEPRRLFATLSQSNVDFVAQAGVPESGECECYRCGYTWTSRRSQPPACCPSCSSDIWSVRRMLICRICDEDFFVDELSGDAAALYPTCGSCGSIWWLSVPFKSFLTFSIMSLGIAVIGRAAYHFDWSSISRSRWIALVVAVFALFATVGAWTRRSAFEGWQYAYMGGGSFRQALWITFLMPVIAPAVFLGSIFYVVQGDEIQASARRQELEHSACGAAMASPGKKRLDGWASYSCETEVQAGSRWHRCLPRGAYTNDRRAGCPGLERCCPPSMPPSSPLPAPSAARSEATSTSRCGDARANPPAIPAEDWAGYTCKSRASAGDEWSRCLRRKRYTDIAGAGCPGTQRCCP